MYDTSIPRFMLNESLQYTLFGAIRREIDELHERSRAGVPVGREATIDGRVPYVRNP